MGRPSFRLLLVSITLVAALVVVAVAAAAESRKPYTLAVIGDVPYSPAQEARLPGWVDRINADADVDMVAHLGDIKAGSTCTDEYYAMIRHQFDRFSDPMVYTPGDNEWTDCHHPAAGAYDPLERLNAVRKVFFDEPGHTLGEHPMRVRSQKRDGYPENVSFTRRDVAFAAVHIVGSNNDVAYWTGNSAPTAARQLRCSDVRLPRSS